MSKPEILNRTSADRLAYVAYFKAATIGATATYDELSAITGRICKPGGPAYPAMLAARNEVERDFGIAWRPLADHSGLKCLSPEEVAKLPADVLSRLGRASRRARRKLAKVGERHLASMNDGDRVRFVATQSAVNAIASALDNRRIARLVQAVETSMKPLPVGKTLEILKA